MTSSSTTTLARLYLGCEIDGDRQDPKAFAEPVLEVLAGHGIKGATMWSGLGLYNGSTEPTVVVEVLGHGVDVLSQVASELRARLHQDEVAWTLHAVERGCARDTDGS